MDAWAEMNTIETVLDRHLCMTATGFSTKTQEVLFNNQLHVADYFTQCLRNPRAMITNHARRNFLVAWFLAQIVQYIHHCRALALWEADHTMCAALDVARTFVPCVEYYLRLWPAVGQLSEYKRIYAPLVAVCVEAGVEAPAHIIPLANLARGAVL
ncbi:hypothetical protein TRAPUB_6272 [Trametes pubescens]|uniref:Uncharacterized protein n=1 Tax=Trametes pubescens TaxID=154538 RepID=A0A1M2V6G1_TRAPU|nr:hypothetical protein TRAPUB_6272 [Trametes pubescens]